MYFPSKQNVFRRTMEVRNRNQNSRQNYMYTFTHEVNQEKDNVDMFKFTNEVNKTACAAMQKPSAEEKQLPEDENEKQENADVFTPVQ